MSAIVRELYTKYGQPPAAALLKGERRLSKLLSVFDKNGVGKRVAQTSWLKNGKPEGYYTITSYEPTEGFQRGTIYGIKYLHDKPCSEIPEKIKNTTRDYWIALDWSSAADAPTAPSKDSS
ncbi:hypothetical protein H4R34_001089 [Dimargaris verticillata]|uniref:Uncharacterized protein n=1 Tax=Dimargaris verticillata TaxID=2761393 RepID=A0A9W8BC38_9FUNG|nr:hypothetical protein H4R34_001089 [Dimargaris verticillata]